MPPSQVVIFEPLNGVVPPSGKVNVSAPLSVVNTMIVLSSWPMSSSFFMHIADVVVHLLHAGFVDAPVLAAGLADHRHVLVDQHGGDVHARRVVPDEERLVGLLRIVAVEEVDDLGRDFLVDPLRSLERQRTFVLALSDSWRCRRTCTPASVRGGVRQTVVFGSTAPGTSGDAGDRRVLARRRNRLLGRGLVDVREAHALHRVEVIQVAPELLEAVRGRQRVGVVAEMVLAELAGVVAEIEQELGERRGAGPQIGRAAGQLRGIMPVRSGFMPVKKALRPAVQLCSA